MIFSFYSYIVICLFRVIFWDLVINRLILYIFVNIIKYMHLTDSSPALSAFHAITGIPKNPAIWRKYWDAAVCLPNCSVLVKYSIATLPFETCWHKMSVISKKYYLKLKTKCQKALSLNLGYVYVHRRAHYLTWWRWRYNELSINNGVFAILQH